jgi:hypothetical protein
MNGILMTVQPVPVLFREMQQWGYCKDEWTDNGNFPFQLYVREARRMVSDFVFVENDRLNATVRLRLELTPHERLANNKQQFSIPFKTKHDSVGLGSYNMDIHMTQRLIYSKRTILQQVIAVRRGQTCPRPYINLPPSDDCRWNSHE